MTRKVSRRTGRSIPVTWCTQRSHRFHRHEQRTRGPRLGSRRRGGLRREHARARRVRPHEHARSRTTHRPTEPGRARVASVGDRRGAPRDFYVEAKWVAAGSRKRHVGRARPVRARAARNARPGIWRSPACATRLPRRRRRALGAQGAARRPGRAARGVGGRTGRGRVPGGAVACRLRAGGGAVADAGHRGRGGRRAGARAGHRMLLVARDAQTLAPAPLARGASRRCAKTARGARAPSSARDE